MSIDTNQIRRKYIGFFKNKQHAHIERAKLVLHDDPTTLFTSSGMQPLLPYLLGQEHPEGKRLVDSQTCLRTQDIEDVGNNRHTTFFEMLGNWSLGDYFKEQQIRWFFEFLTKEVGLDPEKIYVTAFIGDEEHGIPRDNETAEIWQRIFQEQGIEAKVVDINTAANGDKRGIRPGERIFFYDDKENWWSRGGGLDSTPIGDPAGPDSEVFYDFGPQHHDPSYGKAHPASDSGQFMEIGNQVFMQYQRNEDGSFTSLDKKNVDFGGGLERIAAAVSDDPDVFRISLFAPIIERLEQVSGLKYDDNMKNMRVIADHLRAATLLVYDGVTPSNKEQGYVLRRLVRRAIRFALNLGIEDEFIAETIPVIAEVYKEDFPGLGDKTPEIIATLNKEEQAFRRTIKKGLKKLDELKGQTITGADLFTLYDTYGFPVELSVEEVKNKQMPLEPDWKITYEEKREEQRLRSQGLVK